MKAGRRNGITTPQILLKFQEGMPACLWYCFSEGGGRKDPRKVGSLAYMISVWDQHTLSSINRAESNGENTLTSTLSPQNVTLCRLLFIVNLTQTRIMQEDSLREGLPTSGWLVGMSAGMSAGVVLIIWSDVGRPTLRVGGTFRWWPR